jgi:hypothetical protein
VTERYARILPGALAEDAAKTFHESPTPFSDEVAQAREITRHARVEEFRTAVLAFAGVA